MPLKGMGQRQAFADMGGINNFCSFWQKSAKRKTQEKEKGYDERKERSSGDC
jgi:hypothetical protein